MWCWSLFSTSIALPEVIPGPVAFCRLNETACLWIRYALCLQWDISLLTLSVLSRMMLWIECMCIDYFLQSLWWLQYWWQLYWWLSLLVLFVALSEWVCQVLSHTGICLLIFVIIRPSFFQLLLRWLRTFLENVA